MSKPNHFGMFDDDRTYTKKTLADLLNRDDRYVDQLFDRGLKSVTIGRITYISGYHLRMFIEGLAAGGFDDLN